MNFCREKGGLGRMKKDVGRREEEEVSSSELLSPRLLLKSTLQGICHKLVTGSSLLEFPSCFPVNCSFKQPGVWNASLLTAFVRKHGRVAEVYLINVRDDFKQNKFQSLFQRTRVFHVMSRTSVQLQGENSKLKGWNKRLKWNPDGVKSKDLCAGGRTHGYKTDSGSIYSSIQVPIPGCLESPHERRPVRKHFKI